MTCRGKDSKRIWRVRAESDGMLKSAVRGGTSFDFRKAKAGLDHVIAPALSIAFHHQKPTIVVDCTRFVSTK